jgi:hypothetical protein
MGELGSDIGRYLGYMFSRLLGQWLAQNPQFETYVWLGGGVTLVGVLIYLLDTAIQASRNNEVTQPEPAPNNTSKPVTEIQHSGIKLRNSYKAVLSRIHEKRQRLEIESPKGLRVPLSISAVFLLCGVFGDWPYDFFVLLRVVIFTTCIIVITTLWKTERSNNWLGVLLATMVVYNPLLPIHLHKATWSWLNGLAFLVLGLLYASLKPTEPRSEYLNS